MMGMGEGLGFEMGLGMGQKEETQTGRPSFSVSVKGFHTVGDDFGSKGSGDGWVPSSLPNVFSSTRGESIGRSQLLDNSMALQREHRMGVVESEDEMTAAARRARSRARAKYRKGYVEMLSRKRESDLTELERQELKAWQGRRLKKNNRSRERNLESKSKLNFILAKSQEDRTKADIHFLEQYQTRRKRKNECDRNRRERNRIDRSCNGNIEQLSEISSQASRVLELPSNEVIERDQVERALEIPYASNNLSRCKDTPFAHIEPVFYKGNELPSSVDTGSFYSSSNCRFYGGPPCFDGRSASFHCGNYGHTVASYDTSHDPAFREHIRQPPPPPNGSYHSHYSYYPQGGGYGSINMMGLERSAYWKQYPLHPHPPSLDIPILEPKDEMGRQDWYQKGNARGRAEYYD